MVRVQPFFYSFVQNIFASIPLSIFLMLIYATCIGWATFVEKDYGTIVANDVIYHSWWFELLNVWLLLNILGCMYRSMKYGFKISVQIFHCALVIMIIGAGITRHFGFEGTMSLKNGETNSFITSSDKYLNVLVSNDVGENGTFQDIIPMESFKEGYKISLSPYTRYSSFNLNTKEAFQKELHIKSIQVINYSIASFINQSIQQNQEIDEEEIKNKQKENYYVAKFEVEYDGITKTMTLSNRGEIQFERFGNRFVTLSWGPKSVQLPFSVKLEKFEVLTYPGSRMESSFASYVQIIDEAHGNHEYKISMNNVLDYRGYRFFQSQYNIEQDENGNIKVDKDGKPLYAGTILSVNNDPGKIPTYIGYTLMILGAIWLLFDRDSRFKKLSNFMKQQKALALIPICITLGMYTPTYAKQDITNKQTTSKVTTQDNQTKEMSSGAKEFIQHLRELEAKDAELEKILANVNTESIHEYIENLKRTPQKVIDLFAKIQVQGIDGKIRLMDTYSSEIMRKITGTNDFKGLQRNQFLLGLMTMPQVMTKLRFIQVKNKEILKLLGVQTNYVSFEDLFYHDKLQDVYNFANTQDIDLLSRFQDAYKLYHFVIIASKKVDSERNEFDKQILKLHEKMDFLLPFSIWSYMQIFPLENDENWQALGHPIFLENPFLKYFYYDFTIEAKSGIVEKKWDNFANSLQILHDYQSKNGGKLLLDSTHVQSELLLNKIDIFPISQYFYLVLGILLFFIALIAIISNKKIPNWLGKGIYTLLFLTFILHTLGLLLRWYIGGHAPWSNPYESMLYIAWASALSGIIILRKSYFALCGASFLAGMALLVAHWGFMDPQIGNLQPVLQSYWLNIHVAVIVASYGFLGLSLMLGITNLILFIFRHASRPQIDKSIISLSVLNEMSMIIGILMLLVGTFLGGVWANESWGRYWSWDSKETWSLVSIGVYACVLHVRLLRPLYLPYIFNVLSVLAFYSIIMTYFGVNYYLATGMHTYAQGEGSPVNEKIYIALALTFILCFLSFFKRKLRFGKDAIE